MESNAILETVNSIIFGSHGVWFLIGAALVYFSRLVLQCVKLVLQEPKTSAILL